MKKLLGFLIVMSGFIMINTQSLNAQSQEEPVFTFVEQMPQFTQGDLNKYLIKQLKYPNEAIADSVTGKVITQFIIEKDGTVSGAEIIKSSGSKSLDEEALRVIRTMPAWLPGKQNGKPVRVRYVLPVSFQLR